MSDHVRGVSAGAKKLLFTLYTRVVQCKTHQTALKRVWSSSLKYGWDIAALAEIRWPGSYRSICVRRSKPSVQSLGAMVAKETWWGDGEGRDNGEGSVKARVKVGAGRRGGGGG